MFVVVVAALVVVLIGVVRVVVLTYCTCNIATSGDDSIDGGTSASNSTDDNGVGRCDSGGGSGGHVGIAECDCGGVINGGDSDGVLGLM